MLSQPEKIRISLSKASCLALVLFLKTGETTDQAPDYIKEAKARTDFLNLESEEQKMIMRIDKDKAVSDAILSTRFREGREEGIEQGIEQGKSLVALELLKPGIRLIMYRR